MLRLFETPCAKTRNTSPRASVPPLAFANYDGKLSIFFPSTGGPGQGRVAVPARSLSVYRAWTWSMEASELWPWQASHDSPSVGEVMMEACAADGLSVWHDKQAPEIGGSGLM